MEMGKQSAVNRGRGASQVLAKRLRRDLTAGKYRPGDRLPPLRELMEQFQLGYRTVNRAVEMLAADGWVEPRQGSGTVICDRREERHAASGRAEEARSP